MSRTNAEKIAFERAWDKRVEEGWERNGKPRPETPIRGQVTRPSIIGTRKAPENG